MRSVLKLVVSAVIAVCPMQVLRAQDLAPRAYIITPVHSNAVTLTWSFYDGGLNFNGTVPITGATGTYSVPVFSYYHSFSFFGVRRISPLRYPTPWELSREACWEREDRFTGQACWISRLGSP
jgi:hypothetical protein